MQKLSEEQIKEIAEMLECGFDCYWNTKTNELLFLPNESQTSIYDDDAWKEDRKKIKKKPKSYKCIEGMTSSESFRMMEDFAEMLPDEKLKASLIQALNNQKPFRHFKELIDFSDYRQNWFDYKAERFREYVREQVGD